MENINAILKESGLRFREISLKFQKKFLKTFFLTKSHETYFKIRFLFDPKHAFLWMKKIIKKKVE
jgi:hypothetical protein